MDISILCSLWIYNCGEGRIFFLILPLELYFMKFVLRKSKYSKMYFVSELYTLTVFLSILMLWTSVSFY